MNEGKKDRRDPIRTVKPRNFVAKNAGATTSGAGAHKDKKKAAKQGEVKHKNKEYAESLNDRLATALAESVDKKYDHEAHMAKGELLEIAKNAMAIYRMIHDGDNLDGWVASYITVANDHLNSVEEQMSGDQIQDMQEGVFGNIADKAKSMFTKKPAQQPDGHYPDGSSIKTPGVDEWKQQYQQAVMAVKNAKSQQEYETASDRASRIKDLLASKGVKVGPVLGHGVAEGEGDEAYVACIVDFNRSGQAMVRRSKPVNKAKAEEIIANAKAKNTFVHPPFMTIYPASAGKLDGETIMKQFPDMSQQGVAEEVDQGEYSDEVGMVKSNLHTIARMCLEITKTMKEDENLPEWFEEKISQAKGMIVSAGDYLISQHEMGDIDTVAEGAKVDRQAMHITKSMMKAHPGMSKDDAEAAAWAHIKHPKKKKKAKEGWTHDTLADQLFEHERTYEDKLYNLLNKKLGK